MGCTPPAPFSCLQWTACLFYRPLGCPLRMWGRAIHLASMGWDTTKPCPSKPSRPPPPRAVSALSCKQLLRALWLTGKIAVCLHTPNAVCRCRRISSPTLSALPSVARGLSLHRSRTVVHVHGQDAASTDSHRPPTCCRQRGLVTWFLGKEVRGQWSGRNTNG